MDDPQEIPWLADGLASDVSSGLRPEEMGAWRVVDALGLLMAEACARGDAAIAPVQTWHAPDIVGLDFGFDPEDPTRGLRLVITPESVEFRLPLITWRKDVPVLGTFLWQRFTWKTLDRAAIADLARQALATGRSVRRTCTGCGKRVALGRYILRAARVVCFGCGPLAPEVST